MGPPIERRCQVSNPLGIGVIKRNPPKIYKLSSCWSMILTNHIYVTCSFKYIQSVNHLDLYFSLKFPVYNYLTAPFVGHVHLTRCGIRILGTSVEAIDACEAGGRWKEQVGFNGAKGVALYVTIDIWYICIGSDLHLHLPLLLGGGIVDPH